MAKMDGLMDVYMHICISTSETEVLAFTFEFMFVKFSLGS